MPRFDPVQTNFTAGELSPRLKGNFQIDKYKQGLQTLENMLVQPHGGVSRRGGFKYVAEVKTSSKTTILHSFNYKDEFSYILEFGDQYIRFYRNQTQIMDNGSAYEVATTYLETELKDLRITQDEDTLYIVHKNHLPAQLTRISHNSWTLADISFSYDGVATVDTIVEPTTEVWTERVSAGNNAWNSICWSPELNLFCAIAGLGSGTDIMTSPDGENWTLRIPIEDNSWQDICWSPDLALFCVVASSGTNRVMTSPDGVIWTAQSAGSNLLFSVCWSPELGLFCAVGTNIAKTSPNGEDWTDRTLDEANSLVSVCWSADLTLFAAVSTAGTNRVQTSPDGTTWSVQAHAGANEWISICWSSELTLFVAVSIDDDASGQVMTSPNGTAWTQRATPTELEWYSVCWSPEMGLFCAVAIDGTNNGVMTSSNGTTWATGTPANDRTWNAVCWSPELAIFCAVAYTGTGDRVMTGYYGIVDGTYTEIELTGGEGSGCEATVVIVSNAIDSITITIAGTLYEIDDTLSIAPSDIGGNSGPITCDVAMLTTGDIPFEWAEASWLGKTAAATNQWVSVCWSPKLSLFCAISGDGTDDRVMTSPDGSVWTSRDAATENTWRAICWSPDLEIFCAVAIDGAVGVQIMTSPDGTNWTSRTSAAANEWRSICWSPELTLFVAVSNTGTNDRVMTSPNGIDWTSRDASEESQWLWVCWSPELEIFCAVAYDGTDRVMTSVDGTNWIARSAAAVNQWRGICWSPELGIFCAVSDSGTNRVMTSLDGTNWIERTADEVSGWYSICWSSDLGQFCAVAVSGTNQVMTSPDGISWTPITAVEATTWADVCWSPELGIFCSVATGGTYRVMVSSNLIHNYPTLCWFFEQRFWLASTFDESNRVWGSRTANYNNFYTGTGLANDAIDIQIEEAAKLLWVTTSEVVLLGANNGAFRLSANNLNEAITPTNIRAPKMVSYGSAFLPAVDIDGNPLFIQRGLRKVRRLEYDLKRDRYKAIDITILSEHITESGIIDIAYADEPSSFMWGVRTDGQLVCLTYEPEYEVFGWDRHIIGGVAPVAKSIAVSNAVIANEDELWAVISRTIDGSTVQYVEFLTQGLSPEDIQVDAFFVDSGVTKTGSAFTTFDGLDHLEGETVQVLADGLVQATKVVSSGEITITAADKAHAGLPYTSTLETLPIEGGNPIGSAMGRIKRISKVVLRLYKSLTFTIGDILGNTSEDVVLNTSLYTDDSDELAFYGGHETGGQMKITISDPVPFTLLAIMYKIRTGD